MDDKQGFTFAGFVFLYFQSETFERQANNWMYRDEASMFLIKWQPHCLCTLYKNLISSVANRVIYNWAFSYRECPYLRVFVYFCFLSTTLKDESLSMYMYVCLYVCDFVCKWRGTYKSIICSCLVIKSCPTVLQPQRL